MVGKAADDKRERELEVEIEFAFLSLWATPPPPFLQNWNKIGNKKKRKWKINIFPELFNALRRDVCLILMVLMIRNPNSDERKKQKNITYITLPCFNLKRLWPLNKSEIIRKNVIVHTKRGPRFFLLFQIWWRQTKQLKKSQSIGFWSCYLLVTD